MRDLDPTIGAMSGFLAREQTPTAEAFLVEFRDSAYRLAVTLVGCPEMAEDVTQDALVKGFRNWHWHDPKKGIGWMNRIVFTTAMGALRDPRVRRVISLSEEQKAPEWDPDNRLFVEIELGRISDENRALLLLRYCLRYTVGEIAEMTDVDSAVISFRLRGARREMRRTMCEP